MKKHELISALSGKILSIRTESGYTQEEMAEVLGLSKKHLCKLKKGGRKHPGQQSSFSAPFSETTPHFIPQSAGILWMSFSWLPTRKFIPAKRRRWEGKSGGGILQAAASIKCSKTLSVFTTESLTMMITAGFPLSIKTNWTENGPN